MSPDKQAKGTRRELEKNIVFKLSTELHQKHLELCTVLVRLAWQRIPKLPVALCPMHFGICLARLSLGDFSVSWSCNNFPITLSWVKRIERNFELIKYTYILHIFIVYTSILSFLCESNLRFLNLRLPFSLFFNNVFCVLNSIKLDGFEGISLLYQTETLVNSFLDSLLYFITVSQPSIIGYKL